MSTKHFHKRHHIVDASHIRQYPKALATDQHDALKLAVDQFTPKDNPNPSRGDVTLIAAHANGVGKELYEPLWDDLYEATQRTGHVKIRSIWMMDVSWQGESAVLNEQKIGDDRKCSMQALLKEAELTAAASWFDTPRDLFLLVHHFREEMKMPMIGVGHSMGGNNIVSLATIHPRLFTSVILIDPVIQRFMSILGNFVPTYASTFRRDVWPSREEATKSFLKNKFYQSWDKRVFEKWIQHGLRELPTAIYPDNPSSNQLPNANAKPVTLTTPKHQEVFTFLRANHPPAEQPLSSHTIDRRTHPDVPIMNPTQPFYRPETLMTFAFLPYLRPRTLYIFPQDSTVCPPAAIKDKLDVTGYGAGGNGGHAEGGVKQVTVPKTGHFITFDDPSKVAALMADYIRDELALWRTNAALDQADADAQRGTAKFTMSPDRIWWTRLNKDAAATGQWVGSAEPQQQQRRPSRRGPKL